MGNNCKNDGENALTRHARVFSETFRHGFHAAWLLLADPRTDLAARRFRRTGGTLISPDPPRTCSVDHAETGPGIPIPIPSVRRFHPELWSYSYVGYCHALKAGLSVRWACEGCDRAGIAANGGSPDTCGTKDRGHSKCRADPNPGAYARDSREERQARGTHSGVGRLARISAPPGRHNYVLVQRK